jgi:hypothetical protein
MFLNMKFSQKRRAPMRMSTMHEPSVCSGFAYRRYVAAVFGSYVLALSGAAMAGRPLATEDAGTNSQAQCQIEAWVDSASDGKAHHFAPACGLIDGLELGLEWVQASPAADQAQGRAVALKWAPEWLTWHDWRFGAKLGTAQEKAGGERSWHQANVSVLAIASLPLNEQWTLHLNAGHTRNKLDQTSANTYGAALTWAPLERLVVFAELNGDSSTPATQSAGLRWWLLPEQLGLDVTASRANATPGSRSWGVGIGWYGIKF